jgi:hypothetical protein
MSSADTPSNDVSSDNESDGAPIPRPRPGYRTPEPAWSQRLGEWAPIMAGMLRTVTGVVGFVGSLLFMPLHLATPFLVGVSLLMAVGGCTSTLKTTRDEPRMRATGRRFVYIIAAVCVAAFAVAGVKGAGAFAPDLSMFSTPPPAPVDDGTIRFEGY